MSTPLILAALWVIAASAVAMLPMRHQFAPGLALLLSAPILITWIGIAHGFLITLVCTAAVLSMFRKPLWYLGKKTARRLYSLF